MVQHAEAASTTLLDAQVDRRRFLKMAAVLGAAAGAGDVLFLARPAQGLTTGQVPADATELDAGVQVLMSVCQNCHSRCGIMARVKDGIVLKIDGNPYHPNNLGPAERPTDATPVEQAKRKPGRLCAKGQAGVQVLYDPYRIKQAFEEIAARLKPLRDVNTLIDPAAPELGPIANQVLYAPGRTIEERHRR